MKQIVKAMLWITVGANFGAAIVWILGGLFFPDKASFAIVGEHLHPLVFEGTVLLALLVLINRDRD